MDWVGVGPSFLHPSVLYPPERRKKETKIYVVIFPLNKKPYRKPVCGLIPAKERINHFAALGSNKPYRKPVYGLIPINQGINHSAASQEQDLYAAVADAELPTSSEKGTGAVSQKKLASRFQVGEANKG